MQDLLQGAALRVLGPQVQVMNVGDSLNRPFQVDSCQAPPPPESIPSALSEGLSGTGNAEEGGAGHARASGRLVSIRTHTVLKLRVFPHQAVG